MTAINAVICNIIKILSASLETFSNYALVAMMIERCVVVFFPLHAKTLVNRRFTCILLCVCIFPIWVSFVPLIPFNTQVLQGSALSTSGTVCVINSDGPTFLYLLWSMTLNLFVVHVVATLILVIVLGIKLLANRRRRRHLVGGTGDQSAREYSVVVVMLLLAGINIVIFFPSLIITMINFIVDISSWPETTLKLFFNIGRFSNELLCVAHSINFIVYFCRISSFRSELVKIFSCCITK